MEKKLTVSIALALLVALASCSSYRPTHYYAIDVEPTFEKEENPLPLTVTVNSVRAPSRYQDQMVYRKSKYEMGFYELSEWIEPPAEMLTGAVSDALDASRLFRRVDALGIVSGSDLILLGELNRFDQVVEGEENFAECELLLELIRVENGEFVWRHQARAKVKQGENESFAAAMSEAVSRVLTEAVSEMRSSAPLRELAPQPEVGK